MQRDVVMRWLSGRTTRRQFDGFVSEVTEALVRTGYLMTFDVAEAKTWPKRRWLRWRAVGTGSGRWTIPRPTPGASSSTWR